MLGSLIVSRDGPAQPDSSALLVGSVVAGKYHVDALLGRGGMGAVYRATNQLIGKRVALKFLTEEAARDRDAASRFQREAVAASIVESSHIVQIFDTGTTEAGLPFLVMELLQGEDLRQRLEREQRLRPEAAADIAVQVLRALTRAHAAGIVHRDLKPDNVFLCQRDDDGLLVKLVDFGISKLAKHAALDTLTGRGTVLGTAFYMSPEQAQAFSDVDGRTDLFSLGAILYECVCGRPPHRAPTYEAVLIAICTRDAAPVRSLSPEVSADFAAVIERALARDRSQRFASAEAMLEALLAALPDAGRSESSVSERVSLRTERAPVATAELTPERSRTTPPRQRVVRVVAAAALALLSGFAVAALWLATRSPSTNGAPLSPSSTAAAVTPAPVASAPAAPAVTPAHAPPELVPVRARPSVTARETRRPAPSVGKVAERPAAEPRPRPGVARGLELVTQEP